MPRFFFHLYDDLVVIDEEGLEMRDFGAASEKATEIARSMVCESVKQGHVDLHHRIEVADERGEIVLKLEFRDAFTISG